MTEPGPGPLADTDEWPVAHLAACVVEREGVRWTTGDLDRPFALASLTKPLVATAILLAVEEASLSLETPAGPEGSTVAHLLAHASGLGPDGAVLARPEQRRIYSNAAFDVLGATLESTTGMTVASYLDEGILGPLAMSRTQLAGSPAHGATSTASDLARWASELLAPQLLASTTVDGARSVAFPGLDGVVPGYGRQTPNDWGLGFEIKGTKAPHWTAPAGHPATYGHFGRSGTFVWIDPDRGRALVVLTDEAFGDWALTRWPRLSQAVADAG